MKRTSWIMQREMLEANVAPNIYEELKAAWKEESEALQKSIKDWEKPDGILYAASAETANLVKYMPVQSSLRSTTNKDNYWDVLHYFNIVQVKLFLFF